MTKIISAFPGTGKTYATEVLSKLGLTVSDSDSSQWPKDDFPQNYIGHIRKLISEGKHDVVFISSHDNVREELEKNGIDYTLVYPDPAQNLKTEYMNRYVKRGSSAFFIDLMQNKFDDFVASCSNPTKHSKHYVLSSGQYMSDILNSL